MKVLLLCPTCNGSQVLPEWMDCVYALEPGPSYTIFLENNSRDDTLALIEGFTLPHEVLKIHIRRDAQEVVGPYGVIAHVRQLLLDRARRLDPDYVFWLDDDVYAESYDAMETMMSLRKDVVGGAFMRIFPEGLYIASKWRSGQPGRFALYRRPPQPVSTVAMTSMGAMLMSRRVVQDRRLNFFPFPTPTCSEDFGFCMKAQQLGYKIYLDSRPVFTHNLRGSFSTDRPWDVDENRRPIKYRFDQGGEPVETPGQRFLRELREMKNV